MGHDRLPARAGTPRSLAALALAFCAVTSTEVSSALTATAGEPVETVVDFDEYPANVAGTVAAPKIRDEFRGRGIVFDDGVTALRFSDKSTPAAPDLPRSGEVVITSCYAQELCTNRIRMSFPDPLQRIAAYVGSRAELPSPGLVVITAFDAAGEPVGEAAVTLAQGGLVPADNLLAVDDARGRIRSAEVGWAHEQSDYDSLVIDDVSLTRFAALAALTSDPARLTLLLREDVVRADLIITNTGNVAVPPLSTAFRPEPGDPDQATRVDHSLTGCDLGLAPGESCVAVLDVTPLRPGTTMGVLELAVPVPRTTGTRAILRVPITLTVSAATTPTRSATPTGTRTVAPTEGPTQSRAPTEGPTQSGPSTDSDYSSTGPLDPASYSVWMPVLGALVAMAALGMLLGPTLTRRLRRRSGPRSRATPAERPRVRVRAGALHGDVTGPHGPVMTLVAVAPPAVTRVTENPR